MHPIFCLVSECMWLLLLPLFPACWIPTGETLGETGLVNTNEEKQLDVLFPFQQSSFPFAHDLEMVDCANWTNIS